MTLISHIATKLLVPTTRSRLLRRPRLSRKLNRCIEAGLTVIAAPAGFGKTTLLGEWCERCEWPVAWISLDEADNDPIRFWSYMAAALDKLDARVGENVLQFIHTPNPSPIEYLIPTLINTVTSIPDHFVLVLDDYHCIAAQDIHRGVAYLLDYLPRNMHLVIASRVMPPLPLARWRARGQLIELNAADLRFSQTETEGLLNEMLSLDLDNAALAALQARTEGWAVGLHLAALAISGQPAQPPQPPLDAFQGDHRYVVDYLGTEVMARLNPETRAFLLQTSILDTLTAPLCNAVTLRSDSQALLDDLYRRQLFITALSKGAYRYHPLFADFLRARLAREAAAAVAALHERASAWYEAQGDLDRAISHTLAANDVERGVQLIEQTARVYLMRGEFVTLRRWFDALPQEAIFDRPLFCLVYAWVLTNAAQLDAAGACLDHLEAHLPRGDEANLLRGEASTVRARMSAMRGQAAENIHFCKQALALLPESAMVQRSDAYLDLSFAFSARQAYEESLDAFEQAIDLARKAGNLRTAMMAMYYASDIRRVRGQLQQAAQSYQHGLDWCHEGHTDSPSPLACWARAGLGLLSYEWNDLDQAIDQLQRAVQEAQQCGEIKVLIYPRLTLACALQARGEFDRAHDVLDAAAEVTAQMHIADFVQQIELARLRLWLAQGQNGQTADWLRRHGIGAANETLSACQWAMLACYHLHLGGQRDPAALERIAAWSETEQQAAEKAGRRVHVVQHSARLALLDDALGRRAQARQRLADALELAEPMGLVRTFVDYGLPMAGLCRDLASRRRDTGYLNRLLAAFNPDPARRQPRPASVSTAISRTPLVEPLRPREIEVLEHIADGRSNQEIADEMIMALSTVKWYLRNIYDKLNVSRRTQALARARELNLH